MSSPATGQSDFFQQHGDVIFPVLGVLGAIVLIGGCYIIWRGPHRSFLPTCLSRRMRRNLADGDGDSEKRTLGVRTGGAGGQGPMAVGVFIPRRAERGRQGTPAERAMSRADEFREQVVASRRDAMGSGAYAQGTEEQGGRWAKEAGDQRPARSAQWEGEERLVGHHQHQHPQRANQHPYDTTPASSDHHLPRQLPSVHPVPSAHYPNSSPAHRPSDTTRQAGSMQVRDARSNPAGGNAYTHRMEEAQDSNMW